MRKVEVLTRRPSWNAIAVSKVRIRGASTSATPLLGSPDRVIDRAASGGKSRETARCLKVFPVPSDLHLQRIGAVSAIATVVLFVTGGVLMGTSGVQVLIPETGSAGREWIEDVDAAGGAFFAGAWLVILMGFVGMVALIGFYARLQSAGPVMVLAPVLGVAGLILVTVSHLLPIGMGYELVPAYVGADPAAQQVLAATADTLAATAVIVNYAGNFLGFGVAVPMYGAAILFTGLLPRWIGWLGLAVGALAGWLGLLGPASSVVEGVANIGFIGFFVFMVSMGVTILLRTRSESTLTGSVASATP